MALSTDQSKHLLWFVTGGVQIYFQTIGYKLDDKEFQNYLEATLAIAKGYLEGRVALASKCSDCQRDIAYEAERLFKTRATAIEASTYLPDWTIHDRRRN